MSIAAPAVPDVALPPGLVLVEVLAGDGESVDVDAPESWAYRAIADVEREIELAVHGYDDMALEARDALAGMRHQEYATKRRFVVVRAEALGPGLPAPGVDDVVAHLFVIFPTASNPRLAEVYPFVRAAARGRGIGTALLTVAERLAADAGRTTLLSATSQGSEPGPGPGTVTASTGAGRVDAETPETRFALAHGYALEQVERHSVLDLPLPGGLLDRLGGEARAVAGDDYRLVTWRDEVPDDHLDHVGRLFTRMSTDAPVGGVDYEEDPWDAQRVRTWIESLGDTEYGFLMTAAEHVPSGELAAFTLFEYPLGRDEFAHQEDTLVLQEHRGHRLGMLVKVANLEALSTVRPATRRIHTGNAEENAHMLAINVALGFRPAGGWASWQRLTAPAAR
ncbi:GNAT family N-acetyltransferase [Cellulosimicrobium marinum]|uniref:GNAT family N-acetyltransferase n=1 Tax=Cellulosimicrobium marinum TaxID=1638992 RepID=UPI001E2BBE89|nr:GNAT family N-acetyltransferase [Cellulosimicrobium marinum]MCB7136132.1 GNAT family N-acetyltransferase [Cellulosimicrobium marinum]